MRYTEIMTESATTTSVVIDVQPAFRGSMRFSEFDVTALIDHLNREQGRLVILYTDPAEPPSHKGNNIAAVQKFYKQHGLQRDAEYWPKSYAYITPWLRYMAVDELEAFITTLMLPFGITDGNLVKRDAIETFLDDEGIEIDNWQHFRDNKPILPSALIARLKSLNGDVILYGGSTHRCLLEINILLDMFVPAVRARHGAHVWNDDGYFR
jgi:hypothetical protein